VLVAHGEEEKLNKLQFTMTIKHSAYKKFHGIPIAQKEKDGYFNGALTDFRAVDKFDAKLFEQP
jgi:hypothetical protein